MPESASERFARAIEGVADEPGLEGPLHRELAVVAALREAGGSARLDDIARLRMRRQVLAGFAEELPERRTVSGQRPAQSAAPGLRGRLVVAAAAALCLLMSLSGMSLLMARDALPGDELYAVKRSAESAKLGLTFGAESRGFKHLQFAEGRVDEMEALAARTSAAAPAADAGRYLTALESFDADAAAGSRLLIGSATNGDGNLLAVLRGWAEQQHQRIDTATAAIPQRAAARAGESMTLLRKIDERVSALRARLGCLSVTSGASDDVGLLPADGTCAPLPIGSGARPPNEENRPWQVVPDLPGYQTSQSQPVEQTTPLDPLDPRSSAASQPPAQPLPLLPAPNPEVPADPTMAVPLPILPPLLTVPPLAPGLPGLRVG